MAIFYNHIKGCGNLATNTHSGSYPHGSGTLEHTDAWTFIKFADVLYYTKEKAGDTSCLNRIENSPIIYLQSPNYYSKYVSNFCYSKDYSSQMSPGGGHDENYRFADGSYSLGHILTTNATGQYVNKEFEFKSKVTINNLYMDTKNSNSRFLDQHWYFGSKDEYSTSFMNSSVLNFSIESGIDYSQFTYPYVRMYLEKSSGDTPSYSFYIRLLKGTNTDFSPTLTFHAPSFLFDNGDATIKYNLHVGSGASDTTKGIIKADNKCEALYFNAASDRRAKTNITPTEFSALHVVNSIPTYTFNYNNKEEKTLGLIAQEAAEFDLDGFNMVDNLEATGQDGDYMQMKESKLVYVLWKAIQELSAEVEELKAEIRNLK